MSSSYSQPMISPLNSPGVPGRTIQHSTQQYMSMTPGVPPRATSFSQGQGVGMKIGDPLHNGFSQGASLDFHSGAPTHVELPKEKPKDLTVGIPTPAQISQQQAGYQAALDRQLAEGVMTITKENEIEKQMLRFSTEKTIALFTMQEEEKLTEAIALLDEQLAIQTLEFKKALVERNLQLSAQANGLAMDYQMKFLQTELATKQYEFAVQYYNVEHKLEEQYDAQVRLANTGTSYADPARVMR